MSLSLASYAGRLDYLAKLRGARTYLEIGVNAGQTFFQIDLPFKVAVDPVFRFDPETRAGRGEFFFSLTSDEFFEQLNRPGSAVHNTLSSHFGGQRITFDLIFIDGLHTFEQTLRDFENSLNFSHEATLWLIDDVIPCDEISAVPDMKESIRQRKKVLLDGTPWHGDVFKVIPAIHDRYPLYSYCTLIEENPQTVVWKAARRNVTPAFSSIEAISEMTCADIAAHAKLYMLAVADELPGLIGRSVDPEGECLPDALARFRSCFQEDYQSGYYKRLFRHTFRFIPRWINSIRKRLPRR